MRLPAIVRTAMLALLLSSVCASQVDERCSGTALDHPPKLLSSLDPLKDAARKAGYQGPLLFRLTVTEAGSVRDLEITPPPERDDSGKVKDQILKLRFCPAVRYSRYAEVRYTFDIEMK